MRKFIAKINEIYKPFRKVALMMFLFISASQVLALVAPYLYGKIIDAIIEKNSMKHVVMIAFFAMLVHITHAVLLSYYREKFELQNLDFSVFQHITKTALEKTLGLSMGQQTSENSGIQKAVINNGENAIPALAFIVLYEVFPLVLQVVFSVGALMYLSTTLGLIACFAVVLFVGITLYVNERFKDELKEIDDMKNKNRKMQQEVLTNAAVVQTNVQEERMSRDYEQHIDVYVERSKKTWIQYMVFSSLRNTIMGVSRFAIIVLGAYYVFQGVFTPGYLVVFLTWTSNAFNRLEAIGSMHRRCMEAITSAKKYFKFVDIEPAIQTTKNPIRPRCFEGKIEFRDVSFRYPARQNLLSSDEEKKGQEERNHSCSLNKVNFSISPGQRVAFVGHSGAGKSTIVRMLLRAYDPDEGQIIVDDNDLRFVDLKRFRESMGVVEQDVALFDETLRYNICYGLNGKGKDVTEEELNRIVRESCIDKFWSRLEKGYDTIVGERGVKLSGGERQRVGIARALIKKPQILIFDEATSHLDTENEASIRKAIEKASRGRTTIIIAHRLSTIKNVDKIFVMEKGMLVGQGTHKELMESCEAYKRLISSQIASV